MTRPRKPVGTSPVGSRDNPFDEAEWRGLLAIFLAAALILLNYSSAFGYRVTTVLFVFFYLGPITILITFLWGRAIWMIVAYGILCAGFLHGRIPSILEGSGGTMTIVAVAAAKTLMVFGIVRLRKARLF